MCKHIQSACQHIIKYENTRVHELPVIEENLLETNQVMSSPKLCTMDQLVLHEAIEEGPTNDKRIELHTEILKILKSAKSRQK